MNSNLDEMKKHLAFIIFVLLFLFFAFFAKNIALMSSNKSCAKFIKIWEVKGATLVKFEFENKEGKIFSGNIDLKNLNLGGDLRSWRSFSSYKLLVTSY